MKPVGCDFLRAARPANRLGIALLVSGIVLCAWSVGRFYEVDGEAKSLEAQLGSHGQRYAGTRDTAGEDKMLDRQVRLARDVIGKNVVPWDALLADIESASSKDVGVLSIQPNAATGELRITGEARNAGALAGYVERLQATRSLRDVYLTGHEMHEGPEGRSIRFGVVATWARVVA
jgi:hypothetical protein